MHGIEFGEYLCFLLLQDRNTFGIDSAGFDEDGIDAVVVQRAMFQQLCRNAAVGSTDADVCSVIFGRGPLSNGIQK